MHVCNRRGKEERFCSITPTTWIPNLVFVQFSEPRHIEEPDGENEPPYVTRIHREHRDKHRVSPGRQIQQKYSEHYLKVPRRTSESLYSYRLINTKHSMNPV